MNNTENREHPTSSDSKIHISNMNEKAGFGARKRSLAKNPIFVAVSTTTLRFIDKSLTKIRETLKNIEKH